MDCMFKGSRLHSTPRIPYKWSLMFVIGLGNLLAIMDGGMVAISLPKIIEVFDSNASTVAWISLAYFVGIASPLMTLGWLADTVGRKRMYILGTMIVTAGLAFSAVSQSVPQLICVRLVSAIGSSMILANDNALLTSGFPSQDRGKAQGISNMALGLGLGLGFLLGGVLIDTLGWRALFWIRMPAWIILAILAWRIIQDDRGTGPAIIRLDALGSILLGAATITILLAINQAGKVGIVTPFTIAMITATVILVPILVMVERKASSPIIDLDLFKNRVFSSGMASQLFMQIAQGGWNFLAPFYLIYGMGYSSSMAGLIILPFHLIRLIFSPIGGVLADRYGSQIPAAGGGILLLGGLFLISSLASDAGLWLIVLTILIAGSGLSIFLPANNSSIMGNVPFKNLGSASSFLAGSRAVGTSIGIALAAAAYTIFTNRERVEGTSYIENGSVDSFEKALLLVIFASLIGIPVILARGKEQGQK